MDENLNLQATEVFVEVPTEEVIEAEPTLESTGSDAEVVEVVEEVTTEVIDVIEVEIEEGIGWSGSDGSTHSGLYDRNNPDQHIITSITGLREELDEIERLKTVYSNGVNVANYYKWEGDKAYDTYGYFVSLASEPSEIKICDGSDIFGVSVDAAGFIGGQDATVKRDNYYGLIVNSGLVNVRCELGIDIGDCVVSNAHGYAKKADSDYGYKVLAMANKNGVEYAVIALGAQADMVNELGIDLGETNKLVEANYKNIVSAVNIANQAYNKAGEVDASNKQMSEKVDGAVGKVEQMGTEVDNLGTRVAQSTLMATQAKAIAESAATSAESLKNEAIASANDTASKVGELTKSLEPLTTWTDPETGNSGAPYLANYINNGLATKAEIETVEDDLEHSKSAILQNAKSLQSLVVSIDKYSVGEYSTAYGLTLDQATNILEPGIIYVPTTSHKEKYQYVDGETTYEYEREFTPRYLYQWGRLPLSDGRYGWITIDKYYNAISDINASAPSVYFSAYEMAIGVGDDYGYWYTNVETIYDIDGNITEEYEPYTLYKWDEDRWVAVATLAGNVNNRAMSQIRQTANEIALEVTNARGSAATLGARITDTESEVQTLAAWTKDEDGNQYNLATIKQTADGAGASIAQVVEAVGENGEVNAASIVTAINNGDSSVVIDASHVNITANDINLTGYVKMTDLSGEGATEINGTNIKTGTIDASKVVVANLDADNIVTGTIDASKITVKNIDASSINVNGDLCAFGAKIGGWEITGDGIDKKDTDGNSVVGMHSGDILYPSLVNKGTTSPVRFYAGGLEEISNPKTATFTFSSNGLPSTQTFTLPTDDQDLYRICGAIYSPIQQTNEVTLSVTVKVDTYHVGTDSDGNTAYSGVKELILLPSSVLLEDIVSTSSTVDNVSLSYLGGGIVRVRVAGSTTSPLPPSFVSVPITIIYKFTETLDVDVVYDETSVCATLRPQVIGNATYRDVDVQYFLCAKDQKFTVLADGSLYAQAANIGGNISAISGDIAKLKIENGGLSYNNIFSLNDAGLQFNNSQADIVIGSLSIGIDEDDEKTALFATDGPLKIVGSNKSSIELMTDEDRMETISIDLYMYVTKNINNLELQLKTLDTNNTFLFDKTIEIGCMISNGKSGEEAGTLYYGNILFKLRMGDNVSDKVVIPGVITDDMSENSGIFFQFEDTLATVAVSELIDLEETPTSEGERIAVVEYQTSVAEVFVTGSIVPTVNGSYNLGRKGDRLWNDVFAQNCSTCSSDRNKKNSIQPLSGSHDQIFDALQPVSYKFNENTSDRTHTGLIAQDVKEAVENAGLTTQDFAAYCEWKNDDGSIGCGLRYGEFISLCIDQIQKLKKRVEELEEKLNNTN